MIDTIVLLLSHDTFRIISPDAFTPAAYWINRPLASVYGMQSKQNSTAQELRSGIYKPRLILFASVDVDDAMHPVLKIELSLPKLLFGNNFEELEPRDFAAIITKLQTVLAHMGVEVSATALTHAPVSAIHYAKNIPLTDGTTPYHFINKLKESNITLSRDTNQTDYRNEGHSYKWHCNAYEVVFYDKIKDLQKAQISSKRAIEKDSVLQLHLLDALAKKHKLEILRMEVRLNKRHKMKQLFALLGIKTPLTLKGLFKRSITQKVLLHYLDELESKHSPLLDYRASSDKTLLVALITNNPDLSPKQVIHLFGLKKVLESVTMRELGSMFKNAKLRSWQRLVAEASAIGVPHKHGCFEPVRNMIKKIKPLRGKFC